MKKLISVLLMSFVCVPALADVEFDAVSNQSLGTGSVVYSTWQLGGKVGLADKLSFDKSRVLGVAKTAVGADQPVVVLHRGVITDAYVNMYPGTLFYLGVDGGLADTKPQAGGNYCVQIGYAIASNKLLVDPKPCD